MPLRTVENTSAGADADTVSWSDLYDAVGTPVVVCQADETGKPTAVLYCNDPAQTLLGQNLTQSRSGSLEAQQTGDLLRDEFEKPLRLTESPREMSGFVSRPGKAGLPVDFCCRRLQWNGAAVWVLFLTETSSESRELNTLLQVSAEDYLRLLEPIVPVLILDEDGRILCVNTTGAANVESTPEALRGRLLQDLLPERKEISKQRLMSVLQTGTEQVYEDLIELPNGPRWFRTILQPVDTISGRRLVRVVAYEITDIRDTEQKLRETTERLRHLADHIPGGICQYSVSHDGMFEVPYISDTALAMLCLTAEELRSDPECVFRRVHPEDRWRFRVIIENSIRNSSDWNWEGRLIGEGRIRWVQAAARVTQQPDGTVTWDCVAMDITTERQMAHALKQQEQQFRRLVETCGDAIGVFDGGELLFANNAAVWLLRADSAEQLMNLDFRTLVDPESLASLSARFRAIRENNDIIPPCEAVLQRLDGTHIHVELTGAAVVYQERLCIQVVVRDVTERKAWAAAIQESEERFRTLFRLAPVGIAVTDSSGRVLMSNDALRKCLEVSKDQIRNASLASFLNVRPGEHLEWSDFVERGLRSGAQEQPFRLSGGRTVWCRVTLEMLPAADNCGACCIGIFEDVTREREAESRARHRQKLEAVGQLTGGVAHDFNNLLAVISGNLELLRRRLKSPLLAEYVQHASVAATRGAQLTRQLLAFGRRAPLNPLRLDINHVIRSWHSLLRRTIPETTVIELRLHKQPLFVVIDQAELENSLLNLVLNSCDAMPDGGTLTISTSRVSEENLPESLHRPDVNQDFAVIRVSDTGQGMEPTVLERAFDPYFTTKPSGAGSGLGLSMVYGFVKQSGGQTVITSRPGAGCTVSLYLPVSNRTESPNSDAASREPTARSVSSEIGTPSGPSEKTVLVVEDDDRVRTVILKQLEVLGFRTISADCGLEALRVLRKSGRINAVLTDVVMPGNLQGAELATQVRREYPDTGVVLMSGYTDQRPTGQSDRRTAYLEKPFTIRELGETLKSVLECPDDMHASGAFS